MVDATNYINELRNRREEALEYIVDEYSNLIFKVAYSFLNQKEMARECINDVLLKIWDNIGNFNGEEKQFRNWVCTITKYTALNMLRKEIKHFDDTELKENISENNNIEDIIGQREELKTVINIIDTFKEQDREIFYKRFILGQSLKEVSEGLNLNGKYVGQRISRCRKVIKKRLGKGVL